MKTVKIYEIGEEVYIKAKVTEIIVENGEVKYMIKAEHSNNALDHKYTDHQLIQIPDQEIEEENEEVVSDLEDTFRKKYSSSNRKEIERRK